MLRGKLNQFLNAVADTLERASARITPQCTCKWGKYGWRTDDSRCPIHGSP